jgi:hypothetical protein
MNRLLVLFFLLFALSGLAACSKSDDMSADSIKNLPPGDQSSDHPREVRPPRASSGISSDPFNPSGAPGPGTGLGTSSSRF